MGEGRGRGREWEEKGREGIEEWEMGMHDKNSLVLALRLSVMTRTIARSLCIS